MESKKLGFWSIVLLGINGIIGSGIFLLPNKAMAIIGPASLLVMLFDMLLVLAITFCFAEASGLFKENGGAYIYAKEAFGDFIGYEVGFLSWATRIIAFSTMSVGFATALGGLIPSLNTVMMKNIIISVIFIVLAVINLLGIKLYEVIQNLATIAKILPFILFIGMGIFYIEPVISRRLFQTVFIRREVSVPLRSCCSLLLPGLSLWLLRQQKWKIRKRICRRLL